MAQGRVQVQELQSNVRLTPAGIQSDTYAAPAQRPQNQNLSRLADALGSFSNSLGNLASVTAKPDKDADERAIMASQKKFDGLTLEEHRAVIASGERPNYTNKAENQGMMAIHGNAAGQHLVNRVQKQLATVQNWNDGDVEAAWVKAMEEDVKAFGPMSEDPNFYSSYRRQVEAGRGQTINAQEQRKVDTFVKDKSDAAFIAFDSVVSSGAKAQKDPEAILKELNTLRPQLGKEGVLGVNPEQVDKEWLNLAARVSNANPELSLLMLTETRKGRNGAAVSLATTPEHRDRVIQIQEEARKAIGKREEAAFEGKVRERNVGLLEGGNLDAVEDIRYRSPVTGEEKVKTAKQQEEEALYDYRQRRSPEIAAANREDAPTRMAREFKHYRMSGQKHPDIEREVNGVFAMASASNKDDPEATAKVSRGIEAYKWLRSESTQAAKDYVKSEEDLDFMELALMGQQYMGQDEAASISFATRATQLTKEGSPSFSREQKDSIVRKVNNLTTKEGWIWNSETRPTNAYIVEQRVTRLAMAISQANGVDLDKSVEMASEAVKNTSTSYRGVLLNLQGMNLPDDFTAVMDEQIAEFGKVAPLMLKRNGLTVDDLGIIPAGSGEGSGGRFILVNRDNNNPVLDDKGHQAHVDLKQVRTRSKKNAAVRREDTLYESVVTDQARQKGIELGTDSDGKDYYFDKKTKEIYDLTRGSDRTTPVWKKTGKRLKNKANIRGPGNVVTRILDNQRNLGRVYRETAVDLWNALPEVKIGN